MNATDVPETALGTVQAILLAHYGELPRPDMAVGLLLTNLRAELLAGTHTAYRASHDSIPMGLYTTAAEARKHCEAKVQQEEPAGSIRHLSWWTDDIGDDAEYELHITPAETGARIRGTGYVVAPVEIAAEHDEEADE